MNNGTTPNGVSGKQTVCSIVKSVLTSGITVATIVGVVYGYGALNNRVEYTVQQIQAHGVHLERIDQLRAQDVKELSARFVELKTELQEQRTDIKWLVKQQRVSNGE